MVGDVNKPGNYEIPMGTPFSTLLELAGGVRTGRKLKAVIPGGSSAPVLPASIMMELTMDYDSIAKAGSMLGSGAVIVMDDSRCMVESLLRLSYFYQHESCGQCTPCREGTGWLWRMVDRIEHGHGQDGRHRPAELRGRQHPGPHDLRAGRCRRDAGARDDQALPQRVRAPRRTQDLPGSGSGLIETNTLMIEIELDGKKVSVPAGSMVMHAADAADTYIPHFCYHKKLSIAANCRMCLVDIEKAPKPMPACATPVTQGMIVRTKSDKAIKAQQSVMEFLLINHPLDCPICDQGGECQLQDLAVGYGGSASRYTEEKRVVFHKPAGPLISMEEMSRCIHCTRCVRFGQEVAGVMELGMAHRGEHAEIQTFVGRSVDSELSGNMIDICPVGAITSASRSATRPARGSCRAAAASARTIRVGANLVVQVKNNQVLRVVPYENEDVNECWIADRDRFSYEAPEQRRPPHRPDDQAGRPVADGRLAHRARTTSSTASSASRASSASPASARWATPTPRSKNCTCWPSWCARWAARASTTARATPTSRTPAACAGWARRSRR